MSGNVGTTSKIIWKESMYMQVSQEYRRMLHHPASIQAALNCVLFDILNKPLNADQLAPGSNLRRRLHFCHITVGLSRRSVQRSQNSGLESLSSLQ